MRVFFQMLKYYKEYEELKKNYKSLPSTIYGIVERKIYR